MPVTFIMLKGWQASVSWWLAGLGVDLLHGISNFIVTMLLYTPLSRALKSLTTHVIR
jgi:energy-coupling factor transport system substrate-specific component